VKKFTAKAGIPGPSVERLAHLYTILSRLEGSGSVRRLSSKAAGELLAVPDHTIRKDLSFLKTSLQAGPEGGTADLSGFEQGYDVARLRSLIGTGLGLETVRPVCLVGLGRLGGAILHKTRVWADLRYPIAAAFDASVYRIELTRTDVPLFHSREIARVTREKNILIGIVAVPAEAAPDVAERLAEGGVRAIVNFAPVLLSPGGRGIIVRNVSLTGELDIVSAYLTREGV